MIKLREFSTDLPERMGCQHMIAAQNGYNK